MKIGLLINLFHDKSFSDVLDICEKKKISYIEIGAGGYPGKDHCDPEELLRDEKAFLRFRDTLDWYPSLKISALACHGNPVHPDKKIAEGFDRDFRNAVILAGRLGVDTITCFSGCPGDSENSKYPNWVTCAWPDEYGDILKYQWEEVLIPYWKKTAEFAKEHGVTKIAFEMHPGFCVYNPETLLRLREAVGETIGANFDPSHLVWQGIDPVAAVRCLGDAIFHVHAKDTYVNEANVAVNGVLDTKSYRLEKDRAWLFRACGYGHDAKYWKDLISELHLCGYNGSLSIEHEDSLMPIEEGLDKALEFLRGCVITGEKPSDIAWAN